MLRRACYNLLVSASRSQAGSQTKGVTQLRPAINKISAMYNEMDAENSTPSDIKLERDRGSQTLEVNLENLDFSTLDRQAVHKVVGHICDAVSSTQHKNVKIHHLPEGLFLSQIRARMSREGYVGRFVRFSHDLGEAQFEKVDSTKTRARYPNPYRSALPAPC